MILLALENTRVQENDGDLTVTLQWQVRSVPPVPLAAFVHVIDRAASCWPSMMARSARMDSQQTMFRLRYGSPVMGSKKCTRYL